MDKHSCKLAGLFKCQSMNLGNPVCLLCFLIFSRAIQTNMYPQLTWQRVSFSQLYGKSEPALFSLQISLEKCEIFPLAGDSHLLVNILIKQE